MQWPELLQNSIDALLQGASASLLRKAREGLSQRYREGSILRSVFQDEPARLAYLSARMPATYAAVFRVLSRLPFTPDRILDLGAGPGTASWAASVLFPHAQEFTLIEACRDATALGKQLAQNHPVLARAKWICASLPTALPSADVAILSYSLGELEHPEVLIDFWHQSDIPLLAIIEPGTPRGFALIRKIRDQILSLGGCLLAPCPHAFSCPLQEDDWCHFSARLPRTRLHRFLKEGSLGFEDEKYSYLIASRSPIANDYAAEGNESSRILARPQKHSGHVRLRLCTSSGSLQQIIISRSMQKYYKTARDADWGDTMTFKKSNCCD